ncbi:MAG: NAD(P)/FAD-dependent oxidoreductase [Candidatus Micrarchaeia archaeon]
MAKKKLFIVGGGAGATILANHVSMKDFDITVISNSEMHVFQPAFLYIAFKGASQNVARPERELLKKGISLIIDEVKKIDLEARKIYTNSEVYSYDYIAIATGTSSDVSFIQGLKEVNAEFGDYHTSATQAAKLWSKINNFFGGTIAIGQASPVIKCPPSPLEGAFLIEELLAKKHLKSKSRIVFFTPYPRAYSAEPVDEQVAPLLKERGIEVMTFFDIDRIDIQNKIIYSIEGDSIKYDLPIIIPGFVGTPIEFVQSGVKDSSNFIIVDKNTMKIRPYDNAFAIGDCTNLPTSKAGVGAELEAKTVAKILNGEAAEFNGRTNCPFDVGYNKATFVISSYTEPALQYPITRMNHFMKMMMERIYWHTLSGRFDFIFDSFFKRTDPSKLKQKYGMKKKGELAPGLQGNPNAAKVQTQPSQQSQDDTQADQK